jgi:hypothetical protein
MNKSNYDLVLEVIEYYDDKKILDDFKSRFVEDENINEEDYIKFCYEYISDGSDGYYIDLNWKFIESGGDWSVFDNE